MMQSRDEPAVVAEQALVAPPEPTAISAQDSELEALKARLERDAQATLERERLELVARLLPVLDDLDRALSAGRGEASSALLTGVSLVHEQLVGVLGSYGLERFDPRGERFDPRVHEAMAVVAVDRPALDGRVAGVLQAGYRVGERVVQPAKVYVGRQRAASHRTSC
jgi:molecular chaperone GrpE